VHIHVCRHEERLIGLLASKGMDTKDIVVPCGSSCRFLSERGCELADIKPFQCRLYPLLYLTDGSLGIDLACTFSGEYLSQLRDPASDARRHFKAVKKEASLLGDDEKRALADWSRYVCDAVTLDEDKMKGSKQ
jgi:Fe-S-cluster containining protein